MNITLLLFLIGILGFVLNRKNIISNDHCDRNNAISSNIININFI